MNRAHDFPGILIAIEGIDGAGKTTQAHFLQEHLQSELPPKKIAVFRTKEPTTGRWGQILRDSALTGRLSMEEEIDTFIKDRKEHVEEMINPALKEGQVVIVDRYYFSNMAYQGARGAAPEEIMARNEEFAPEPDLLVFLDIEPKVGLQRIKTRGDRANHFEKTGTLRKAREIFLSIKKPYLLKLDALESPELLREKILQRFHEILATRKEAQAAKKASQTEATVKKAGNR